MQSPTLHLSSNDGRVTSTFMARGSMVWYNGKVLPADSVHLSLFTHALHYGVGAFEGIRAYKQTAGAYAGQGAIFRLREHMQRFLESMKILDLEVPFTLDQLCQACVDAAVASGFQECYLRPIGFIGDGPLGVYPGPKPPVDVAVVTWEWGSYLGDKSINEGTNLKISSFVRPHVNSVMTKGKVTGQYVTGVLAKREAISLGFDEALMLDTEGYLAEGTGENIFVIKNGEIKTTPQTSILNGITRQTVMDYFAAQGKIVKEARFTRDELWCADEVFLTGTAAEITPVRAIDNRKIGDGKPGPLSQQLKKDYAAMVRGTLPTYGKDWLTPLTTAKK